MSQCCGKIPSVDDVKASRKSSEVKGRKFQGDIGEMDAANYMVNERNYSGEFFDPKNTGIDSVFRDGVGKLVLVESKFSIGGQLSSTKHGKQGSVEWIQDKAERMCDRFDNLYSPDNAKIGAEILRVGPENVHYVKYHRDPVSMKVHVQDVR